LGSERDLTEKLLPTTTGMAPKVLRGLGGSSPFGGNFGEFYLYLGRDVKTGLIG
jgi:hypothetical protein